MRRRILLVFFLLGLLGTFPGVAQSNDEGSIQLSPEVLSQDISTGTYIELALWIQSLGIEPRGDKNSLQRILAEYFEVELPGDPGIPSIEILQTRRLSRWAQTEGSSRTLVLVGDVQVLFIDRETESTHTIRAQRVFLDEDEDILVAEGDLVYELRSGERIEVFTGAKLYFDIEDWSGMFLGGESSEVAQEDGEPQFRYTGGVIRRSSNDLVLLKNGVITSSVWDPPAYSIQADEVIVYGAGEWSIQGGVLYLGNIPLAGIPGFFYPGEELFFHPAVGSDTVRGQYIHTTYYFLGRAEPEDSLFDFLRFSNENQDYVREIRGLFLRDTDERIVNLSPDSWTIQADYYSRLGFHLGSEWSLSNRGILRSFDGYLGLALTRNLYGLGGTFTPFYFDSDQGTYESDWSKPYVLGTQIPFRFGVELRGEIGGNNLTWRWALPYYSDPYFPADLFTRSENLDWSTLLGISSNPMLTSNEPIRSNLLWQSNLQGRIDLPGTRGLLSSIQVNRFSQEMTWRSKSIDSTVLPASVTSAMNSPESSSFIVNTLTPLRVDFSLQGTFYPLENQSSSPHAIEEASESENPDNLLPGEPRQPWDLREPRNEEEDIRPEDSSDPPPVVEALVPQVGGVDPGLPGSFTLGYEGSNSFEVTGVAANPSVYVPSPGGTDFDYWQRGEILRFSIRMNAIFPGQFLRLVANSSIQWTDRVPFASDLSEAETLSLENSIRGSNVFSLGQTTSLILSPFRKPSPFESSQIVYTLSPIWYSRSFSQFTADGEVKYNENPLGWDKDSISAHSFGGTIGWNKDSFVLSTSVTAILPPLTEEYQIKSSIGLSPYFSFSAESGVTRGTSEFLAKPLVLNLVITPISDIVLGQSFTYNLNEFEASAYTATFEAWIFSARFLAEQQKRQEFQVFPTARWVNLGEEIFLPSNFALTFKDTVAFRPGWKNRILSNLDYNLTFQQGLQRISDSVLTLDLAFNLSVFEFLDFSFRTRSSNRQMYLYFSGLRQQLQNDTFNPPNGRNIFVDLAKSFNFFSIQDRQDSNFNLDSLSFLFTHYLGDWNIESEYSVRPVLNSTNDGYTWDSRFNILVQWKPISQISREVRVDKEGILSFGDE